MITTTERGNILRAMRAYINASQAEVAEASDVGRRTIWQAEAGEACSDRTWQELIEYYGRMGLHLQGDGGSVSMLMPVRDGELPIRSLVAQIRTHVDMLAARVDQG